MLLVLFLISQIALALSRCPCKEYSDYYNGYSYSQPYVGYEYQQYSPYQCAGYSYGCSSYTQPAYDSISVVAYPYPVPLIYEKEVETCPCKSKYSCKYSDYEPKGGSYSNDYCSARCTCTSTDCDRIYKEYETFGKSKCNCPKYEDGNTWKCICFCEDFRDSDYKCSRWDDCEYRYRDSECGCGYKWKY